MFPLKRFSGNASERTEPQDGWVKPRDLKKRVLPFRTFIGAFYMNSPDKSVFSLDEIELTQRANQRFGADAAKMLAAYRRGRPDVSPSAIVTHNSTRQQTGLR